MNDEDRREIKRMIEEESQKQDIKRREEANKCQMWWLEKLPFVVAAFSVGLWVATCSQHAIK